jgi:hypothetical protein
LSGNRILAGLCLVSLLLALPQDLPNIWTGLNHPDPTATWKLSLGLSLKTLMAVVSVLGLWQDSAAGYAFLLGSSAQNLLVASGELLAVEDVWIDHVDQIAKPTLEAVFRIFCLGYLVLHWRKIVGLKEKRS